MRKVTTAVVVAVASLPVGWTTGLLWRLGNWAASFEIWSFVVLAFCTNLAIAAVFYYLLRGAVHLVDGGLSYLILLMSINLLISLGVAAAVAGAVGAGATVKMGSHFFVWGMSYAYGQVIHDLRHGTWLHE